MGWKVPPGMITALQTVHAQAKEELAVAEGETKTLLEEVQNLTLVRIRQFSIFANCVQRSSLLCLTSHCSTWTKVH